MNSCLYFGEILHARYRPKKHRFKQKLFMTHLFLDESDLYLGLTLYGQLIDET